MGPSVLPIGHIPLFRGYNPHPHAWRFFIDERRFVLATCGRRSAKTHTGARRMLRRIFLRDVPEHQADVKAKRRPPYDPGAVARGTSLWWQRRPRLHYWVVAESFKLLKEPKRYILEALPRELIDHANASNNAIWLKGDILIEFISIRDPKEAVGSGLKGIWVEEAARIKPDAWDGFLRPLLSDNEGWAQFTTTPLGEDWTYHRLFKKATVDLDPDYGFHTWKMSDNVRAPHVVEDAKRLKVDLPPAYYRRECEADYSSFIGQIYEDFDEDTVCLDGRPMVTDDLPEGVQLVRRVGGQDWGFTAPGAQVVAGLTSADVNTCHVWVVDEEYSTNQLVETFWVPRAQALGAKWRFREWVADPAEPDNIDRMKRHGVLMVGHKNYTKAQFDEHERSVRAGIRVLKTLMHQRRLHVTRKCPNLIRELKSYRWDQDFSSNLLERPAPGQSEHAATALRYLVTYALRGANFVALDKAA